MRSRNSAASAPLDVDLAQRRRIQNSDGTACGQTLPIDGLAHRLTVSRVVPRTLPLADVFECRAPLHMPLVHRRRTHRIGELAHVASGERAECRRRIRRPERGRAGGGDVGTEGLGENRQRVHVARLALIGAHSGRRVALQMLDRAIALARRERDVRRRDVVLEIDEVLVEPAVGVARGNCPEQPDRRLFDAVDFRQRSPATLPEPARGSGGFPGLASFGQGKGEQLRPVAAPGRELRLARLAGNEGSLGLVEREPATGLREEMNRRIPAPGHAYEIARYLPVAARVRGRGGSQCRDRDTGHRHRSSYSRDRVPGEQLDASAPQLRAPTVGKLRAHVDQRYAKAGVGEVERGTVGSVVVGEHHRIGPGAHGIPVDVALGRRREHHARTVVVPEHERALMRSGGEHDLLRSHLPQALADSAMPLAMREMIGTALEHGEIVVIVVSERGGP